MEELPHNDPKGPRYRAQRINTLDSEWIKTISDSKDCLVKSQEKIKKILLLSNKMIADTIVDFRDGIELPEQLGYLFLGSCPQKIRKNVDFKKTNHYLKVIQHRNWESDDYLAKIFYTNYETKYKFKFNDLWGFKACRNFTTLVGVEYPKNWKKYIQVDHSLKVARLYREVKIKDSLKAFNTAHLENYDPLDLD